MVKKLLKLSRILVNPAAALALFRYGVAAGVEHRAALRPFAFRTVVDVGANRGQFALAARRWFPQAVIFSFEPLAVPAARFRQVFAGDRRTELFQFAIGPEADKSVIHVSRRDDSSSLLLMTDAQERIFPGTTEAGTETVSIARLSDFLDPQRIEEPALLKLDVQGYELKALEGCVDLLPRFQAVYVECSFMELYRGQALADQVIDWLRARGFQLVGCYNVSYDYEGRAVQMDALFTGKRAESA